MLESLKCSYQLGFLISDQIELCFSHLHYACCTVYQSHPH
jgi:hypothetical protein